MYVFVLGLIANYNYLVMNNYTKFVNNEKNNQPCFNLHGRKTKKNLGGQRGIRRELDDQRMIRRELIRRPTRKLGNLTRVNADQYLATPI